MKSFLWGPYAWHLIHWITLTYQPDKKESYTRLFHLLIHILPCPICRTHYSKQLNNPTTTLTKIHDRNSAIQWGNQLHNQVNLMLGKKKTSIEQFLQQHPVFVPSKALTFLLCCLHDYVKTKNENGIKHLPNFLEQLMKVFPIPMNDFIQFNPVPKPGSDVHSLIAWYKKLFAFFRLDFQDPIFPQTHPPQPQPQKNIESDKKNPSELWSDLDLNQLLLHAK